MTNLLNYFITANPGPEMRFFIPLFALSGILIGSSIVFSMVYKKKKKTDFSFKKHFKSVSKILLLLGIGLLFVTLMRFENISYFSMRLWLYIMCLLIVFSALYYGRTYKNSYLKDLKQKSSVVKTETKKYSTAKKKR